VNTDIVRRMIEAFNAMDADALRPLLDAQAKHSAPGSDFGADLVGSETIVDYFRTGVFPAFHSVRFEVVHMYEDQDQGVVVVEWRSHLAPRSGRNYSNTGVFVVELRGGKVVWVREYFDTEKSHANV